MYIPSEKQTTDTRINMRGGEGQVVFVNLASQEELPAKSRFIAKGLLEPGCSIGFHIHDGESEVYYILSGNPTIDDNGTCLNAKPGDTVITYSGNGHAMKNDTDQPVTFIATIILD
ncbi:MAG: cupin domain-containing protein [Christensenellales bacterium]|jgi:mannose-6-phosphate isomerase-like protein (cupin superfamily)